MRDTVNQLPRHEEPRTRRWEIPVNNLPGQYSNMKPPFLLSALLTTGKSQASIHRTELSSPCCGLTSIIIDFFFSLANESKKYKKGVFCFFVIYDIIQHQYTVDDHGNPGLVLRWHTQRSFYVDVRGSGCGGGGGVVDMSGEID